jgi:hypothetical protein
MIKFLSTSILSDPLIAVAILIIVDAVVLYAVHAFVIALFL